MGLCLGESGPICPHANREIEQTRAIRVLENVFMAESFVGCCESIGLRAYKDESREIIVLCQPFFDKRLTEIRKL